MAEVDLGRLAYEAAAKVSGCEQPWAAANQQKWNAAAEAVREPAWQRGYTSGYNDGHLDRGNTARDVALEFYYHWHNSPGTNTAQGFDSWWELNKTRFIGDNK